MGLQFQVFSYTDEREFVEYDFRFIYSLSVVSHIRMYKNIYIGKVYVQELRGNTKKDEREFKNYEERSGNETHVVHIFKYRYKVYLFSKIYGCPLQLFVIKINVYKFSPHSVSSKLLAVSSDLHRPGYVNLLQKLIRHPLHCGVKMLYILEFGMCFVISVYDIRWERWTG